MQNKQTATDNNRNRNTGRNNPARDNTIDDTNQGGLGRKIVLGCLIPLLILAAFGIGTMVFIALNKKPQPKEKSFNPFAVMGAYAVADDIRLQVTAQGEAQAQTEIDLVPEVGGKIVYVSPNFIQGGTFRKGETLIRIDDSDYKVAVIRAESGVAQAEQALAQEIAEGEIALRDFEELGQGEPTALALRKPQRQRAEAALQAAQAELQAANLQLTRTYVKAPFNGRVKAKNSDLGQFVSPGFRLGRIFSTNVFEVRLPLTDPDLQKLNLPIAFVAKNRSTAPEVRLSAQVAGQEQIWKAHIMRTDSSYDTQTRALFAIAEIDDPYGKGVSQNGMPLAPGLFVTASIGGQKIDNVIVLPRDGLRPEDKVYVVDEVGKAEIRDVNVIDTTPEIAVLSAGVSPGELIIMSPMEQSRVSMTLKVLDMNNPDVVLVEPPEPEWLIEARAKKKAEAEKPKKRGFFGRKGKADDKEPSKDSDRPAKDGDPKESEEESKTDE